MHSVINAAIILYRLLLLLYPSSFRRRFGRGMRQAWHATLSEAAEDGAGRFAAVALTTGIDLIRAAVEERTQEIATSPSRLVLAVVLPLALGVGGGYIHLQSDADSTLLALVVAFPLVCGFLQPGLAGRAGLLLGTAAVGVQIVALHGVARPPHGSEDAFSLAPLIVAWAAAVAGRTMRGVVRAGPAISRL